TAATSASGWGANASMSQTILRFEVRRLADMTPAASRRSPLLLALFVPAALAGAALVGFACLRSPALGLVVAVGLCLVGVALRFPDAATFSVLFLLYSNVPAVG